MDALSYNYQGYYAELQGCKGCKACLSSSGWSCMQYNTGAMRRWFTQPPHLTVLSSASASSAPLPSQCHASHVGSSQVAPSPLLALSPTTDPPIQSIAGSRVPASTLRAGQRAIGEVRDLIKAFQEEAARADAGEEALP